MSIRKLITAICILMAVPSCAQEGNFRFGSLPSFNFNKKLENGYKVNMKLESRQELYRDNAFNTTYDRTDLSLVLSKRVGLSSILAGGYLMRFDNGSVIHRLIQQFTFVNENRIRLAHRIVFDQTFAESRSTQYRLRFRLAALFPLSGDSIDPTEFYIKLQNELLNIYQDTYDIELRTMAFLGYKFNDGSKLELGLDNRFGSFVSSPVQSRTWLALAWYLAI